MSPEIPLIVKKAAKEYGYNFIEFAGTINSEDYFNVGCLDKSGFPIPIGLPCFIKYDGLKCTQVGDSDFKISHQLCNDKGK